MSEGGPVNFPVVFPLDKKFVQFVTHVDMLEKAPQYAEMVEASCQNRFKDNCMLVLQTLYTCLRTAEHYHDLAPSDGSALIVNEMSAMFKRLCDEVVDEEHNIDMRDKLKKQAVGYKDNGGNAMKSEVLKQGLSRLASAIAHATGLCKEDHSGGCEDGEGK